jgi:hypothetical protein
MKPTANQKKSPKTQAPEPVHLPSELGWHGTGYPEVIQAKVQNYLDVSIAVLKFAHSCVWVSSSCDRMPCSHWLRRSARFATACP